MNRVKQTFAALLFAGLAANVHAYHDSRGDKERPPSHTLHEPINDFQITSYVDGSYNYLSQSNRFTSGVFNRDNDTTENGFTLQQAAFTVHMDPEEGFGMLFNPVLGKDALRLSPSGINPDMFGAKDMGLTVAQGYLLYNYHQFTVKAGEMLDIMGLETFNYRFDKNFSRSIMDGYAQPGIHMGVRLIHKANPYWKWVAGTNNGWSTVRNALDQNHVELGLGFAPAGNFDFMLSLQSGQEEVSQGATSGPKSLRHLFDIYGTWHINPKWSVAWNGDYGVQSKGSRPNGTQGRVVWGGLALYLNYKLNDQWRSSIRGEWFDDGDGFMTNLRQNWREATLTVAYRVIKQLEFSLETRHDLSNKSAFADKTGNGSSHHQQSFALAALYTFK